MLRVRLVLLLLLLLLLWLWLWRLLLRRGLLLLRRRGLCVLLHGEESLEGFFCVSIELFEGEDDNFVVHLREHR